jgi:hypothetical protein
MSSSNARSEKPKIPHFPERRGTLRYFIAPGVLERLEAHTFRPLRKNKPHHPESRELEAPLIRSKRQVRYQAAIFRDRHRELLEVAHYLNQPYAKVLNVLGPQGVGKLSLLRGLAELLTPRYAELLWFEVPSYGDSLEWGLFILKQLATLAKVRQPEGESIAEIAPKLWEAHSVEGRQQLFDQLRPFFKIFQATPMLIVMNGLDAMVQGKTPSLKKQAPAFVEILNFLLEFPSFKIAFASEYQSVDGLTLPPQGMKTLHLGHFDTPIPLPVDAPEGIHPLLKASENIPWLREGLEELYHQESSHPVALRHLAQGLQGMETPLGEAEALEQVALQAQGLLDEEGSEALSLLALLTVMRQPLSLTILVRLTQSTPEDLRQILEHSVLKIFLRTTVQPEPVQSEQAPQDPLEQWVALYRDIQPFFKPLQAKALRQYWHQHLALFYEQEAKLSAKRRVFPYSDTLALEREARFHEEQMKCVEEGTPPPRSINVSQRGPSVLKSQPETLPPPTPAVRPTSTTSRPLKGSSHAGDRTDLFKGSASLQSKATWATSFPNKPPIEATSRLSKTLAPEQASLPSIKHSKKMSDTENAYLQALFELASLYTHLNNVVALKKIVDQIQPYRNGCTPEEAAQLVLYQAFLDMKDGQPQKALYHLKTLFTSTKKRLYSQAVETSLLWRLTEVFEQWPSSKEDPVLYRFMEDYFKTHAAFLEWQTKPAESAVNAIDEATQAQRLVWAKALTCLMTVSLALRVDQLAYGQDAFRLYLEANQLPQAVSILQHLATIWKNPDEGGQVSFEKALACLEKAETLDILHDQKTLQWQTKRDKALLLWQMSQPKRAVQILKQVLQDAKIAKNPLWQALALFSLGELAFDSVNGVEWGLSCMEEALAFGEAVLGSERYHAFNERKIQLQDEQNHATRPLKYASESTQSLGWKYSPAQQAPSESGTTF